MRAQTTLDFAVGVSLFLLTVAFVFAFLPGLVGPFTGEGGEALVAADRVADQATQRLLATGDRPFVLDVTCTTAFFEAGTNPPASCRFDGTTVHERVALTDRLDVNVTVLGEDADGDGARDVLCDDGSGSVEEESETTCATAYRIGRSPPTGTESVVVARRTVSVDGRDATLLVRAW